MTRQFIGAEIHWYEAHGIGKKEFATTSWPTESLLIVVNMPVGWLVGWTAYRHSAQGGDLSKVRSAINAIGWSLTMPFVSGLVALMLPRAN